MSPRSALRLVGLFTLLQCQSVKLSPPQTGSEGQHRLAPQRGSLSGPELWNSRVGPVVSPGLRQFSLTPGPAVRRVYVLELSAKGASGRAGLSGRKINNNCEESEKSFVAASSAGVCGSCLTAAARPRPGALPSPVRLTARTRRLPRTRPLSQRDAVTDGELSIGKGRWPLRRPVTSQAVDTGCGRANFAAAMDQTSGHPNGQFPQDAEARGTRGELDAAAGLSPSLARGSREPPGIPGSTLRRGRRFAGHSTWRVSFKRGRQGVRGRCLRAIS